jgi:hypothetical protein
VHLAPRDLDKLVLHGAGFLAQKRLARGLRLNSPEAIALIATQLLELIRDGRSVACAASRTCCRAPRTLRLGVVVVTNDIFTREDAEFLHRHKALSPERIRAVETGGCPHAAIREDISHNAPEMPGPIGRRGTRQRTNLY